MKVYEKALVLLVARGGWMHLSRLGFDAEDVEAFREYVLSKSGGFLDVLSDGQRVMVVAKVGRLSPSEVRKVLGLKDTDALLLSVVILHELKGEPAYIPDLIFHLEKRGVLVSKAAFDRLVQLGLFFVEDDVVRTTPYAKRIVSIEALRKIFEEFGWELPVESLGVGGEEGEGEEATDT